MGNKVKNIRVWRNMTQQELCNLSEICIATLRKIENQENCKYQIKQKLSKALNYPVNRLFWLDD